MLPPVLHALQGVLVRLIATCDHFLQMLVLRFDDLIRLIPAERGITWSTHLLTRHGLYFLTSSGGITVETPYQDPPPTAPMATPVATPGTDRTVDAICGGTVDV
jgi:hypothetical protein